MGALNATFCWSDLDRSYLPPMGLAAAKIEVLAFKVALTPAFNTSHITNMAEKLFN